MTDGEIKIIILKKLYENRNKRNIELKAQDFNNEISENDILRNTIYLKDDELIDAVIVYLVDGTPFIHGINITSKGVSLIENQKLELSNHGKVNINISNSSQFQIGNDNNLNIEKKGEL
ncbi:MAG TPA: RIP homotypic interaction motif-containing protein [Candidatus Kapabacteria bacterium]|jgi:hypothetical protein|nr:RIP homotypic interaction motif-containing protein [Candidatus Kapabacteria bacterium]